MGHHGEAGGGKGGEKAWAQQSRTAAVFRTAAHTRSIRTAACCAEIDLVATKPSRSPCSTTSRSCGQAERQEAAKGSHGAPGSDSGTQQHCAMLCCAHPGVVVCPALPLCRVPAGGACGLSRVLPVELEPTGWQSGLRQAPSSSRAPALQEVGDAAVERLSDLCRRPKEGVRT